MDWYKEGIRPIGRFTPVDDGIESLARFAPIDDGIESLARFAPIDDARIFPPPPVDLDNPEEGEIYSSMLLIDHNDGRHAEKRNEYCDGCAADRDR